MEPARVEPNQLVDSQVYDVAKLIEQSIKESRFEASNSATVGARVIVHGKPFQPSLMFVGKAEAYPIEEPFRCFTLQ
jgi:hypothetical protein